MSKRRGGWACRRRRARRGPSRRRRSASAGRRRGRSGRTRAGGRWSRSRRPAWPLEREPGSEQNRVLLGDPTWYCSGTSLPSLLRPVPPAIAAVIPITRGSRCASATSASANTAVYWRGRRRRLLELLGRDRVGGVGLLHRHRLVVLLRSRHPVDDRPGLGRVPLLHPLEPALLGGREPLALDGVDVDDYRALRLQRLGDRRPQCLDVVAVDHSHVGEVEPRTAAPARRRPLSPP